jgi:uncharacterized protein YkwD
VLRLLLVPLFVALLVPLAGAADDKKDAPKLSAEEKALIEATNAERKKAGLDPLAPNPKLLEAARGHAANMAKQDKLAHDLDGKTPADRVKEAEYTYTLTAENVAWNQPTPKAVVAVWMNSPQHKENILTKEFTEIGVAAARSAKGERYWVQVFGAPQDQ